MPRQKTGRVEDKQINFRVTKDEYERIKKYADDQGEKVSAICKAAVKNTDFPAPKLSHQDRQQIIFELKAIGRNVNQIAKKINSGSFLEVQAIENLREDIKQLWQRLD